MPASHDPRARSAAHRELASVTEGAARVSALDVPAAFRVTSPTPGPAAVVFGGIHGDEPAGYAAVKRLLALFASGELELTRGSLTLAAGNEAALERGTRDTGKNLNRLFRADGPPPGPAACYEDRRAAELMPLLDRADYLLDLHATSQPTPPFVMCESHLAGEARTMGFARIVTGWGELGEQTLAGDTETYVNARGGKGFTMENGQRDWPGGPACAVDAARRLLDHVGLLPYPNRPADDPPPTAYRLFASVTVDEATFAYDRPFSSFDALATGDVIGRDAAREYRAPRDCVLVMPSKTDYMLAEPTP